MEPFAVIFNKRTVLFSCPEEAAPHLPEGTRIGRLRGMDKKLLAHGRAYMTPRAAKQASRWWCNLIRDALMKTA